MEWTTQDSLSLGYIIPCALTFIGSCFWGVWRVAKKIDMVLKEVSPNGGNSLKDRVVKLEKSNADQTDRLGRIERKIDLQSEKSGGYQ